MAGRTLLLLVVFVVPTVAQFNSREPLRNTQTRFHIAYSSGACPGSTKLELMQSMVSVRSGVADKNCMVEFLNVPSGIYRVVLSGPDFTGVEEDEITLTQFDMETIEIRVPQAQSKGFVARSSVSVSDLRIPKRAAKEFAKADRAMEQQEWSSATASLQRALSIYPQYAAAYNNLSVIYSRTGDRAKEAQALQQAISVDRDYVPAYVNLARMQIAAKNYVDAEAQLKKAAALEPDNGIILLLLTIAEYANHHLDDAISHCNRVHALNNVPHAFAHWTAAFALEQKNQIAEAEQEFRMFVNEEPAGDRADAARKELANIANFLSPKR